MRPPSLPSVIARQGSRMRHDDGQPQFSLRSQQAQHASENEASRRRFLEVSSGSARPWCLALPLQHRCPASWDSAEVAAAPGYRPRIAFGCWINDMRSEALPLQQWPAPHLDEVTVSSILAAMDVQSRAGFNYLDAWGLFATYGYPPDITSAFADAARAAQVRRLISEARRRGIQLLFGMGLFSWGYDQIIRADPAVRGRSKSGQPLDHVMCGATEKAWGYVEKILDTALGNFDFGGVHLESADLGWCDCPSCGGKYGTVGYNCPAQYPRRGLHQSASGPARSSPASPSTGWAAPGGLISTRPSKSGSSSSASTSTASWTRDGTAPSSPTTGARLSSRSSTAITGPRAASGSIIAGAGTDSLISCLIRNGRPPRSAGTTTTGPGAACSIRGR